MLRVGYQSYLYRVSCRTQVQQQSNTEYWLRICVRLSTFDCMIMLWLLINSPSCDTQVEAGSDAPSESKVDPRVTLPAENGLSHTPVIVPKPPSVGSHQPQSAGTVPVCLPSSLKDSSINIKTFTWTSVWELQFSPATIERHILTSFVTLCSLFFEQVL